MGSAEVHDFARRLMREVWEPFDSGKLAEFYCADVVGHHRGQTIGFADIANRLAWDRRHRTKQVYEIADILAEEDRFAIRFVFNAVQKDGKEPDIEVIYFYHLRAGKIAEFWLLASVEFDYLERA